MILCGLNTKMSVYFTYASVGRLQHYDVTIIKDDLLNIEYRRMKLLEKAEKEITLHEKMKRSEGIIL
jgi:hypothetical protein